MQNNYYSFARSKMADNLAKVKKLTRNSNFGLQSLLHVFPLYGSLLCIECPLVGRGDLQAWRPSLNSFFTLVPQKTCLTFLVKPARSQPGFERGIETVRISGPASVILSTLVCLTKSFTANRLFFFGGVNPFKREDIYFDTYFSILSYSCLLC